MNGTFGKITALKHTPEDEHVFLWPQETLPNVITKLQANMLQPKLYDRTQTYKLYAKKLISGPVRLVHINFLDERVSYQRRYNKDDIDDIQYMRWMITPFLDEQFRKLRYLLNEKYPELFIVGKMLKNKFVIYHVASGDRVVFSPQLLRRWFRDTEIFFVPDYVSTHELTLSPHAEADFKPDANENLIFYPGHAIPSNIVDMCERGRMAALGCCFIPKRTKR